MTISSRLTISALLGFVLAGTWMQGPDVWGFNHLSYLPFPLIATWVVLAGLSLWPPGQKFFSRSMESFIPKLVFETRYGSFAVAFSAGLVFYIFRTQSPFLGDGYLIINLIEKGAEFRILDNMDYLIHNFVYNFFDSTITVQDLYGVTSVLAGALAVLIVITLLGKLSWEPWRQTLILALFLFSGPVFLFFGYVESYTYLYVFVSCYLISALLYLNKKASLLLPALFLGMALFTHLSAVLCLPSLLVLVSIETKKKKIKRCLEAFLPPLLLLALSVVLHLVKGYNGQWFHHDFFENGNLHNPLIPLGTNQGIFSINQFKNFWNLLFLTTPVSLIIIIWRLKHLFLNFNKPEYKFLAAHIITLGVAGIFLDRKLGMARDWDLFVAHSFSIFLLAAMLVTVKNCKSKNFISLAVTTSVLISAPWIILETSELRSIERLKDAAESFPTQAQAHAFEELGQYYRDNGEMVKSLSMYESCIIADQYNYRFYALAGAVSSQLASNSASGSTLQKQFIKKAVMHFEEALNRNAADFKTRMNLGKLLLISGKTRAAIVQFSEIVKNQPQNYRAWDYLGKSSAQSGNHQRAVLAFREVLNYQQNPATLNLLAYSLMEIKEYHEAEIVLIKCVETQPRKMSLKARLVFTMVSISQQEKAQAMVISVNRVGKAQQLIEELLRVDPDNNQYKRLEKSILELQ